MSFKADLFEFSDLTVHQQSHLTKVYGVLGSGIITSLLTFITVQYFSIPVFIFYILGIASLISDIALICATRKSKTHNILNLISLYGYALSIGGTFGCKIPTLSQELQVLYYRLFLEAFVYTFIIFAIFSVFAMLTANRTAIYGSALSAVLILSLIRIFIWDMNRYLFIGIIIECLYFVIDTQSILKRCQVRDSDPISDAKILFVDMVRMFIKLLELLEKKEKDKKKKKENKEN